MNKTQEVARIMRESVEVRLSPDKLAKRAGIHRTTWYRCREEPNRLTLDVLGKLEKAIAAERAERANA